MASIFSNLGIFKGATDEHGGFRDEKGIYRGRVDNSDIYDANDVWKGKIDDDGNLFDSDDIWKGRIDSDGNIFDDDDIYLGYLED